MSEAIELKKQGLLPNWCQRYRSATAVAGRLREDSGSLRVLEVDGDKGTVLDRLAFDNVPGLLEELGGCSVAGAKDSVDGLLDLYERLLKRKHRVAGSGA